MSGAVEMRWRAKKLGGHWHVACFSRTPPTETWEKNGDLVFDEREWPRARAVFDHVEIIEEPSSEPGSTLAALRAAQGGSDE